MTILRPVAIYAAILVFAAGALAEETRVKKEEIPQSVVSAVDKLAPGNSISSAKKMTGKSAKDGSLSFEVNVIQDKKALRFVVSPEGKLFERWDLNPKLADAPEPARKLIETASGGAPDQLVKIMPEGKKPVFRFRLTKSVAADGSVSAERSLGNMEIIKNEDAPQPVRDTVDRLAKDSQWFVVKLTGSNATYGAPSYEIRSKTAGKYYWYILSPEGKLFEQWDLNVKLADVPDPVKKAVERATAGGDRDPDTLIKIMPTGGEASYMFRITRDVAEDGSIMPREKED